MADSYVMRSLYGCGPENRTCESCAHLLPTNTSHRPDAQARAKVLTTFTCKQIGRTRGKPPAPWSVLWPTCGKFKEA